MSIDAAEQNPVTQNAPDTGSLSGAPGAPSSGDGLSLNQNREAPSSPSAPSAPSPSAVIGAASTLSGDADSNAPRLQRRPDGVPQQAPVNQAAPAPVQKTPADLQA